MKEGLPQQFVECERKKQVNLLVESLIFIMMYYAN